MLVIVGVILLALAPAFASGLKKTPRDRVGISYGGGPIEGSHFQRIVQPGHALFFNGLFDPLYLYPADQQSYIVSKTPGVGNVKAPDSIVAPTKDRVQVEYQIAAYFKLNTDRLRDFHEQLGLRYKAYTSAGWANLIRDTFRQQIENALAAGDPQVRRRRHLQQRTTADHAPNERANDDQPTADGGARRAVLLRPDLQARRRSAPRSRSSSRRSTSPRA